MTDYEKLVLKGLAQMLIALGSLQKDERIQDDCEQVAYDLKHNSW